MTCLEIGQDPVRPDFLISHILGPDIVIETVGYEDVVYRKRKEATHAQMVRYGQVLKHEPNRPPRPALVEV